MDQADIDRVVSAFAAGARRAKEAGFDAVELHGGMGYLLTQFLSARTNLRHDGYGGELAGRMRFPLEVFAAVRAAVGDGFPVGYRFLADEYVPGGITLDETRPFALELARAGATYLSVMAGCYDSFAAQVRRGRPPRGFHGAVRGRHQTSTPGRCPSSRPGAFSGRRRRGPS